MTPEPNWRVYHAHMLRNARQAKTPRAKAIWLNGAARARANILAAHRGVGVQGVQLEMFGGAGA